MPHPTRYRDLTGQVFNHLTVIAFAGKNKHRMALWRCRCICGKEVTLMRGNLVTGNTKSCGCKWLEAHTKHGHAALIAGKNYHATPTYLAWSAMKHRCTNPKNKHYAHYGGRGIGFDPDWADFFNFLMDMGERPDGMTLERKDNNQGYSKMNCKWAPNAEQQQNRRNNRHITINNETHCIAEWARRWGLSRSAVRQRLERGWPLHRLSEPTQKGAQQ